MAPPRRRTTILVVEDDAGVREFHRAALMSAGFHVIAVPDGLDALRLIEQERPAVIVLDLGLVRLSGRDLQQELRAHHDTRNIPIVVVTGEDTSDINEAELACVLRKPVTAEALATAVGKCLTAPPGITLTADLP